MRCQFCGAELQNDARFCGKCGSRVEAVKKICPQCGREGREGMLFCEYCGFRLVAQNQSQEVAPTPGPAPVPTPAPYQTSGPAPEPYSSPSPAPGPGPSGRLLLEMGMMSFYKGEPTVGFAKYTGKLRIYDDRLELHKSFGNSAGAIGGLVGMAIAANKAKKDGDADVYYFRDVAEVREGRYGGLYRTIVLVMKNGQIYSFAGTLDGGKVRNAVELIGRWLNR